MNCGNPIAKKVYGAEFAVHGLKNLFNHFVEIGKPANKKLL